MDIQKLLAKSPKNGGDTLAQHTLDVVERMGQLKKRLPHLAEDINFPELWEVMFATAWIHDFGKVADGFQKVLRGELPSWGFRHEVLSLGFMEWFFEPDSLPYMIAASAIASHHKDYPLLNEQFIEDPSISGIQERWETEIHEAQISALATWTQSMYLSTGITLGFSTPLPIRQIDFTDTLVRGVSIIYKALNTFKTFYGKQESSWKNRKEKDIFEIRRKAITIRGLILQADRLASSGAPPLKNIELPGVLHKMSQLPAWYDHQSQSSLTQGNALLKAPTGSGKTEAALLWAIHQSKTSSATAIFYILPFQASINAMFSRFHKVYHIAKDDIALMHSKTIQVLFRQLTEDEQKNRFEAYSISKKQKSFSRLHQQPICVGTPYQLLRAGFRLSGYEGQWVMFKNALIIIDEIHGYEPKRLGMLIAFFKILQEDWGVQFYCMTATMPKWLEDTIKSRLSIKEQGTLYASPKLFESFKRHQLFTHRGTINEASTISEIVHKFQHSNHQKIILVVCNKIKTAQAVAHALQEVLPDEMTSTQDINESNILLLHSRYSAEDRNKRETALKDKILKARAANEGLIVIGTQVVEVSLDVDFDTIYTEPAPLEALLQRIGRVNRHRWHVEGVKPVFVMEDTDDWEFPYQQESLMRRTIQLLQEHNEQIIDESRVTEWLNQIYEPEVIQLQDKIAEGEKLYNDIGGRNKLIAFHADKEVKKEFYDLFDGYEVLPESNYQRFIEFVDAKNFIEAFALCVPVNTRQFHSIKNKTYLKDLQVWKVDCYYDSIVGLEISKESNYNSNLL